ncbi:PREDICTED: pentatricopeptide repeat-containing protein At4g21705, mitochondrial-like isoform X1 [Ipomoea nil]|uniref:pentatricopeptide repeat-containing protein At4g21705, mitochondrial-like isoform X1 n=1 Tax=Ipomoea nil TaxID=35883 RepID=UPI000901B758|nr:PREDICTED: pentatricopeptide repeat-containing protein At4g21705, mitochondrial-like isoform X1 [Ipomoea nil]
MLSVSQPRTEFLSNSKAFAPRIPSKSTIPYKLTGKAISFRAYPTLRCFNPKNLYSTISTVRDANLVVPILDEWVSEGRKVKSIELQRLIRNLRSLKRYSNALQVSEWMNGKGLYPFSSSDQAVHLDLIGVVHGSKAAEDFFSKLGDKEKNEKTYGALFNCYVREGLFLKSLSLFERMKEIGYGSSPLLYSNLMCLYKNAGKLEKIPHVMSEMKENGVPTNYFCYNICINAYGELSDLHSMETLLEEMESQPHITMRWNTYSIVAHFYIKSNKKEKALISLMKLEESLRKDALGYNHLISHYANLGNVEEMWRLWGEQKTVCKKHINRDYITMLGCLVKLGELETAERLLMVWDSSCHTYDFRVPNTLLIGYCQKGLVEKAEEMLLDLVKKGKQPTPNSWAIITAGYMGRGSMDKAFECMKKAVSVSQNNKGWRPKKEVVSTIVNWLQDQQRVRELDAFMMALDRVPRYSNISSRVKGHRVYPVHNFG